MDTAILLGITVGKYSFPDDFISETPRAKYGIHKNLQIVTRSRVTVKVDRAIMMQYTAKFQEPNSHHSEVRRHTLGSLVTTTSKPFDKLSTIRQTGSQFIECQGRRLSLPFPCIVKSLQLCLRLLTCHFVEDHIVVSIAIERGIKIDKINRLIGKAVTITEPN